MRAGNARGAAGGKAGDIEKSADFRHEEGNMLEFRLPGRMHDLERFIQREYVEL